MLVAHLAHAQAVHGQVGGHAEQVRAQRADLVGTFQRHQPHVGLLRHFLRVGRGVQAALQEGHQRAVVLAEQGGHTQGVRRIEMDAGVAGRVDGGIH